MALAIFDLDNTLLGGDSDYLWGQFLCDHDIVDRQKYEQANLEFYRQYQAGTLDIRSFQRFSLKPLLDNPRSRMEELRAEFLEQSIRPIILPQGQDLLQRHRNAGDLPLIITATNSFITRPIAELMGVDELIATEPEIVDGSYTGEIAGIPSFQEGKVARLEIWLQEHRQDLQGSHFYSDSHNDLPLLQRVDHPIAVDPDPQLQEHASRLGWRILSLH